MHESGLIITVMENPEKLYPVSDQLQNKENKPGIQEQDQKKIAEYEEAMKELNSKIVGITLTINEQCPELSEFLEEMPATIPNENDPEMTLSHLLAYYESLNSILNNYKLEHPAKPDL
jgi:hypothetical protein